MAHQIPAVDSVTVDRQSIVRTYEVIRPHVRRTPVIELDGADFGLNGVKIVLKLELLQHTGSFKPRGAFANLLMREVPAAGVVAASGGNHGAAVAYAAKKLGHPAKIFVPGIASPAKIDHIRRYGADLVVIGQRYAEALEASQVWASKTGALAVHSYDRIETLLGQGTVGLELEEQCPDLDSLLVAVGGGGLVGGVAAWFSGRVRVVGVEPERAPTLAKALEAGRPVDVEVSGIAADSLGGGRAGALMFPIAQKYVDGVRLVSDEAIEAAQSALWERVRVMAEPGGSAAFAALLSGGYRASRGERVGVVVCGGNTTVNLARTAKNPG